MLDAFQTKLLENGKAQQKEILAYFESLNRSEAMANSAREKLLEQLYSGAPFESVSVGVPYLEAIGRAENVKRVSRDKLIKALKNNLA